MDIHKPKPWHGWAEFVKEIGTIVIGVLIALGGEQAVEWAHQQHELSEARDALHDEVVKDATAIRIMALENRCQLGEYDRAMAWAKGGPRPPLMTNVIFPAPGDGVWESLKSGPVSHMPLKEKLAYVEFYYQVANNRSFYGPMRDQSIGLASYLALDSLTPAEARSLVRDISRQQRILTVMLRNAPFELAAARKAGGEPLPLTPADRATIEAECAVSGTLFDETGL